MSDKQVNKSFKILLRIVAALALTLVLVSVYFNSNRGQAHLSKLLFDNLSEKTGTTIKGQLRFSIPDWVKVDNLLILDKNSDTLLYAGHSKLDVALFKLLRNQLVIEQIYLKDVVANINKKEEIYNFDFLIDAFSSSNPQPDKKGESLQIDIDKINLENLRATYKDITLEQAFLIRLAHLNTGFNQLNLDEQLYDLKDIKLDGLAVSGRLGKSSEDTSSTTLPDVRLKNFIAENISWDIDLGGSVTTAQKANLKIKFETLALPEKAVSIRNIASEIAGLTYKNKQSKAVNPGEINFNDLNFNSLKLFAENIVYNDSLMAADLKTFSVKEKSGLELRNLSGIAHLKGNDLKLQNLDLYTPNSQLSSDFKAVLNPEDISNSRFEADVEHIKLALSEALFFDPTLKHNATFRKLLNESLRGKGKLSGTLNDLNIEKLNLVSSGSTQLNLSGKITNKKQLGFDLSIQSLNLAEKDIYKFVDRKSLSIDIPQKISLNGNVKGTLADLLMKINIKTSQGNGNVNLSLKNLSQTPVYQGEIMLNQYRLGHLLRNPELGELSGKVLISGKSFDHPVLDFKGTVQEITYQGETYRNVDLSGDFKNNIATLQAGLNNPNAELKLDIVADLSGKEPKITGKTNVGKIDLKTLGLSEESILLSGELDIKQLTIDLKKPNIDISGHNITVFKDSTAYKVGDLALFTRYGETNKSLYFYTDFADISLSGNFEYDQLKNIVLGEIDKYFKLPSYKAVNDSLSYYFDINGVVNYHPVVTAFIPSLLDFETITLRSNLNSNKEISFSGNVEVPYLLYDSVRVVSTGFTFAGDRKQLSYNLLSQQISNESFRLRNASIAGSLSDNKADFNLSVKDSLDKRIHSLAGFLESDGNKIKISFDETGTMLFYQNWGGNPYGYFEYSPEGLYFDNIVFSSGKQIIRLNSLDSRTNSPLMIYVRNLDLNFLSKAILQDSSLVDGELKLDLLVDNYIGDKPLSFDGVGLVNNLELNQIKLGNLSLKAESSETDKITVLGELSGENMTMELTGAYFSNRKDALDLKLRMDNFDPVIIQPYVADLIYDLKGAMSGELAITGETSQPNLNGKVTVGSGSFRIKETAALLNIENQSMALAQSKLKMDDFTIKDIHNQDLKLNGEVDLSRFSEIRYDIDLSSENFMIANSEPGQSELFYGDAYLESKLNFKGINTLFKLTGDIHAKDKTVLTLLLPDDNFGEDLNNVVTFVDFSQKNKRLSQQNKPTFSFANTLNINVFADDKSQISILMDPVTRDQLTARGIVNLNIGFDNAGDLFMIGNLDIKQGTYDLTFQAIQKHFDISENSNSNISFTGDPLKGILKVTAEYKVPGKKDLMQYPELKSKDISAQKLLTNLRVDLVLTGEIMSPQVDFQIVARKDEVADVYTQNTLEEVGITLVNDKGVKNNVSEGAVTSAYKEILKQNAIMLLVANNFTASQIFESFTSSTGAGYEDLARRNVSQIISSQLERYASELIKGVDLNIGLESSGGLSESGSDRSTNLNLGLSKGLANDRLVVSVGKNFELENKERQSDEVFDNVEANWLITPDGKYRLKVFRKTQNQTAIEGMVIETGLGFIIAIDYNTWLELIKKKK